jgi:hypothetical protein
MRTRTFALIVSVLAAADLAGCAEYYDQGPYGPYAGVEYDAFYDGYYGPFNGGYWGPGGYFFYADRDGRRFHRDQAGHFRHQGGQGFNPIHGRAPPARGTGGPRPPH